MILADLPTVYLVIVLIDTTMTLVVSASAIADSHGGLRHIALGLGLQTLGYFLYSLRNVLPDTLTILVPNLAMAASISCFTVAIYRFQRRSVSRLFTWWPILIMAGLTLSLQEAAVRIGMISLLFTLQSAFLLMSLLQRRIETVGIGQYYLMVSFILTFSIFLLRLLSSVFGSADNLAIDVPSNLLTVSLLAPVVAQVLIAMGFIIMGKERADERNVRLAMQDELTGLANRRHVLEALAQQLAVVTRANLPLTLLMLDIDYFKQINDEYGHPAGDEVLRKVADCLRARLRAQNIAGRVGGEEFLVVLPQTSLHGALELAESLRSSVQALCVLAADGREISLTISIGVSTLEVVPGLEGTTLIAAADAALYRAKNKGRNRVEHQALSGDAMPGAAATPKA